MPRCFRLLSLVGLACLGGCAFGVQQVVVVPPIGGTWQYTGAQHQVTTPPGVNGKATTFPITLSPEQGRLQAVQSATQIALSLDLPWARLGVSPSIIPTEEVAEGQTQASMTYIQLDLLYKHALGDEPVPRWRALGGLTFALVEARQAMVQKLDLAEPVAIGQALIQSGDELRYEANEFVSGWMLTGGLEYEVTSWCHAYLQLSAGLGSGTKERGEDLQITATNGSTFDDQGNREPETFHLLSNSQFTVTTKKQGVFTSELELPPFAGLVGISVTFPPYHWFRRNKGQPQRPPQPEPQRAPQPPSEGEHPPEGWPQQQVPGRH